MVPDPSSWPPWLRSWTSAYPLEARVSRLFAYSPSPREASGQIIKSSGFERIVLPMPSRPRGRVATLHASSPLQISRFGRGLVLQGSCRRPSTARIESALSRLETRQLRRDNPLLPVLQRLLRPRTKTDNLGPELTHVITYMSYNLIVSVVLCAYRSLTRRARSRERERSECATHEKRKSNSVP